MPRSLPKKNNPHVLSGEAPAYEELLSRRCLGKTNLAVKPSQIGTSNASKPENLGLFEYAHLRAPLPKDLKGSEIFPSHTPQQHPETYFLMRRSKDGFVSATGMFKIAFPWAKLEEEKTERKHLKSQDGTSEDEIAGNVWISPAFALELAKEYQMYDWVRALIDPTEISQKQSSAKKQITPPPKFDLPVDDVPQLSPTRTRSRRSASPSKRAGSPRKSRQTRATKDAGTPGTTAANESLQSSLMTASARDTSSLNGTVATSVEEDGEEKTEVVEKKPKATRSKKTTRASPPAESEEKEVKADPESDDEATNEPGTFKGAPSVEMPILPEAPPVSDTEKMIAEAKEMVQEAKDSQQTENAPAEPSSAKAAKKRKPEEMSEDEEDKEASAQRVKRARVLENKLKQERVRNRALVGVTAAFALAASIPYFF